MTLLQVALETAPSLSRTEGRESLVGPVRLLQQLLFSLDGKRVKICTRAGAEGQVEKMNSNSISQT